MRGAAQRIGVAIALQEAAARRCRLLRIDVELGGQLRMSVCSGECMRSPENTASSLPRPKVKATWPGVWPGVGRMRT